VPRLTFLGHPPPVTVRLARLEFRVYAVLTRLKAGLPTLQQRSCTPSSGAGGTGTKGGQGTVYLV